MNRLRDRGRHQGLRTGLAVLLLCTVIGAAADTVLEVIDLQHRPADEVVPLLRPLLGKDAAVTGTGFKVIVRASPAGMADVKRLLGAIDTPARQLLITVKRENRRQAGRQSAQVSGSIRIGTGEGRIRVPARDGAGVVAGTSGRTGGAQLRLHSTGEREDGLNTQQVRVAEGQPAFITVGSSVPVAERVLRPGWYGPWVQETVTYRDVLTGFRVVAHVHADAVTLNISPHAESPSRHGGGRIDVQRLDTTVTGPLGEWLEIGAAFQQLTARSAGLVYRTAERDDRQGRILVRVEPAPE